MYSNGYSAPFYFNECVQLKSPCVFAVATPSLSLSPGFVRIVITALVANNGNAAQQAQPLQTPAVVSQTSRQPALEEQIQNVATVLQGLLQMQQQQQPQAPRAATIQQQPVVAPQPYQQLQQVLSPDMIVKLPPNEQLQLLGLLQLNQLQQQQVSNVGITGNPQHVPQAALTRGLAPNIQYPPNATATLPLHLQHQQLQQQQPQSGDPNGYANSVGAVSESAQTTNYASSSNSSVGTSNSVRDAIRDGAAVAPCRARGMPKSHNARVSYRK